MKAEVVKDLCSSCGLCVESCPEVFEMDKDDIAKVKVVLVPVTAEECCKEAADTCPGEAIKIN